MAYNSWTLDTSLWLFGGFLKGRQEGQARAGLKVPGSGLGTFRGKLSADRNEFESQRTLHWNPTLPVTNPMSLGKRLMFSWQRPSYMVKREQKCPLQGNGVKCWERSAQCHAHWRVSVQHITQPRRTFKGRLVWGTCAAQMGKSRAQRNGSGWRRLQSPGTGELTGCLLATQQALPLASVPS